MGKMSDRMKQKRLAKRQGGAVPAAEAQLLAQAVAAQNNHDYDRAIQIYMQILAADPHHTVARYHMGVLYLMRGQAAIAERHFAAVYAQRGDFPLYDRMVGLALYQQNKHGDAAIYFERFVKNHHDVQIEGALLRCYNATSHFAETLAFLDGTDRATWNDEFYDVYVDAKIALNQRDEAVTVMEHAVSADPDNIALQNMLAKAYASVQKLQQAADIYFKIYDANRQDEPAALNYALALTDLNRTDEAERLYDNILAKNPACFVAYVNKAELMRKKRDLNAAIACIRKALEIDPLSVSANYSLAMFLVQNENYRDGYAYHEWGWHMPDANKFRPDLPILDWQGEALNGKTILLYTDQGIGDTILHIRYIDRICAQWPNAQIILWCDDKTVDLYTHCFAGQNVTIRGKSQDVRDKPIDVKAALCSLPYLFGDDITTIPTHVPYLKASRVMTYRQSDDDIIIGITWHTNNPDRGHERSLSLKQFAPIAALPNVRLLNLQYGNTAQERADCGFDIIHDDSVDPWHDMQGHIDQIAACDVVITIDNTTAHAAGALGKPTWTLLPREPYWRCWHLDKPSTPWYPTMRVFYQGEDRSYAPLIADITTALQKLIGGDRSVLQAEPYHPAPVSNVLPKALVVNTISPFFDVMRAASCQAVCQNLIDKGYDILTAAHQEVVAPSLVLPELPYFDDPAYLDAARFQNPTLFYKMQQADIIVVNGDGDIHGIEDARRFLYLIYKAAEFFKKPVYIINHSCFPENNDNLTDATVVAYYLKAYRMARGVAVRDGVSHALLTALGIQTRQAFDSLPLTIRTWAAAQPDTVIRQNHIVVSALPDALTDALRGQGYDVIVADQVNETEILHQIRTASLVVSGGYHCLVAALCLGRPVVAVAGDTPDIATLMQLSEQDAPLAHDNPDLVAQSLIRVARILKDTPKINSEKILNKFCSLAAENYAFIPNAK